MLRAVITRFPFTAIVGQDDLRRALLLNAVRPDIGGVLVRGERGTAKSTAARGLAALLPPIEVVRGCPFHCRPDAPLGRCSACEGPEAPEAEAQPTPFVDLPVSATEDRVVGSLDVEHVLRSGERRFEPGLLANAHRGVLYVDEVNLLDDHVVDVLLDAAAMGVNTVEREGISFSHPSRFVLVGTMNPEEGELRPQLTDRFGLSVSVEAVPDVDSRAEILRRRLAFDDDPLAFAADWIEREEALRARIHEARVRVKDVEIRDEDLRRVAELVSAAAVDGHRAELAILKAAQSHAAFEGRDEIRVTDLALAARLALSHRRRRGPLSGQTSDMVAVQEVLERAAQQEAGGAAGTAEGPAKADAEGGRSAPGAGEPKSGAPTASYGLG